MNERLKNVLQSLKNREKEKLTYSTNTTSPTISLILSLYIKAERTCYLNYMQGFKELVSWLTNNRTIPIDFELHKYPDQINSNWQIPFMLSSYASLEIAKVLNFTPINNGAYLEDLNRVHKAVILYQLNQLYTRTKICQ